LKKANLSEESMICRMIFSSAPVFSEAQDADRAVFQSDSVRRGRSGREKRLLGLFCTARVPKMRRRADNLSLPVIRPFSSAYVTAFTRRWFRRAFTSCSPADLFPKNTARKKMAFFPNV
jgi:hypothetical protein